MPWLTPPMTAPGFEPDEVSKQITNSLKAQLRNTWSSCQLPPPPPPPPPPPWWSDEKSKSAPSKCQTWKVSRGNHILLDHLWKQLKRAALKNYFAKIIPSRVNYNSHRLWYEYLACSFLIPVLVWLVNVPTIGYRSLTKIEWTADSVKLLPRMFQNSSIADRYFFHATAWKRRPGITAAFPALGLGWEMCKADPTNICTLCSV